MLQKRVTTGTHLCWSREWWKAVCLFLASRGHSLTVKSLKSDKQSLFLLQYMIYKTLQSFKQPNLRSQFCGDQKKLCLAFLAPHTPEGWAQEGHHSNASAPCMGPHLQPMVLRWQEWVELPKHEIGLKWWREDLFFFEIKPHLRTLTAVYSLLKSDRYHCFSSSYFLVWKPKPTYTITHEFFTWPNVIRQFAASSWNGEDKMPPWQFLQTVRYKAPWPILCHSGDAPQVTVSQGHSAAAGSAEQSNISGSDGYLSPITQA